jgi:hypothetical protein
MADRCPNCGRCKLCNQVQEIASHLLFQCRFTIPMWSSMNNWLGLHGVDPRSWHTRRSIKDWWLDEIHKRCHGRKALASLAMLISWEIWNKRNVHVYRNNASTASMLVSRIKEHFVERRGEGGAKGFSDVESRLLLFFYLSVNLGL